MRRFTTAVPAVLATVVAVLTLSTGTALAHASEHAAGTQVSHGKESHSQESHSQESHSKESHGRDAEHRHGKGPKKVRSVVELTGVLSDTPTATIGSASDTATSTITVAVQGGERSLHGTTVVLTLDRSTVVRRGDRVATAADLMKGDHVSAKVRRLSDGSWLALRVNASGRHEDTEDH